MLLFAVFCLRYSISCSPWIFFVTSLKNNCAVNVKKPVNYVAPSGGVTGLPLVSVIIAVPILLQVN